MKDNKKERFASTADVTLEGTVQTEGNDLAPSTDMQVPNVSSKTGVKEIDQPKSMVNTKKAAEAVAAGNTSANGSAPATFSRGGVLFSGGAGQVGSDLSATTKGVSSYRSSDRTGKRLDPITKKLDLLNAEVIKTKVYESKPLAETDSKQGYNGNYQNDHAITQKINGGHPADPLFERSADEIRMDMLYYADGQYVNTKESYSEYDISDYDTANNRYTDPIDIGNRGSYFNRYLTFKVSKPGNATHAKITDFTIDSYNASATGVDELTSRASSDAALRTLNLREMDRIQMIANAGNESDPKWSCLGDVLYKASAQNTLLADIDATAGDMVYASRRKLAQALAYQINKTAKDGSRIVGPIAEMCNGLVAMPEVGATAYATETEAYSKTFDNGDVLRNGGAGLWLRLNDSVTKYTTKAKLLNLPLSFKSALNVATANCDPLRMHSELLNAIEKNELFSTIDGPYDPLKPVVHTDALSILTPFDLSKHIKQNEDGTPNFDIYTMHYENLRNRYNIKIKNFFLSGIYRWINERADRLFKTLVDTHATTITNNTYEVNIPMTSSSSCISLWDLIVCSSVPYMIEDRINSFTEVLKYERNFSYPYSKTISLKDTQICHSENFSFVSADDALTTAIAKPIAAMKVIMPEIFWCVNVNPEAETSDGVNGRAVKAVLPHYFVQNQFVYDRDIDEQNARLLLSDDYASMAYPSTRSGAMFSYMDTIYGMSEEDYRLSLDRMTVYPAYQGTAKYSTVEGNKVATTGVSEQKSIPAAVYKYGMTADGQPVIPYFAWANSTGDLNKVLSVLDVISTPRELGLMMVAPAGLLTPIILDTNPANQSYANTVSPTSSFFAMSGPGFKVITYHAVDKAVEDTILGEGTTNVDIAGSLRAVWEMICANCYGSRYNKGWAVNAAVGNANVSPFTIGSFTSDYLHYNEETGTYDAIESQDDDITLQSSARYMWTRLQRLPFAINPFDANIAAIAIDSGDVNTRDIFDFLYMLGLCGFRASDYTALVNERVRQRVVKGMDYVTDPFVDQTSLLK